MTDLYIRLNPTPIGEDELAKGIFTKGSNTPTSSLAQTLASAPAQASVPASCPPGIYTNIDLQKTTMLTLELFVKNQKHG